jgi:hypothetical protein
MSIRLCTVLWRWHQASNNAFYAAKKNVSRQMHSLHKHTTSNGMNDVETLSTQQSKVRSESKSLRRLSQKNSIQILVQVETMKFADIHRQLRCLLYSGKISPITMAKCDKFYQ